MTDTHTHIYMSDFDGETPDPVLRAMDAGVTRMVFPCVDMASLDPMSALAASYPENVRMGIGLHPTEVKEDYREVLDRLEHTLRDTPGRFAAIGEVGIDMYWDKSRREEQREAFARQLGWAREFSLPVIIHCREGLDDTLDILRRSRKEGTLPPLVFHSFTGSEADVRRIREVCDPWFGINGVVTFKNAPLLRDALPSIGVGLILLETDAPWLAPVPKRGGRNESAYIPYIRDRIAEVLSISPGDVERATDESAARLFRFGS